MTKNMHAFFGGFFQRELEFRAKLFNVLAIAGTLISICAACINWFTRTGIEDVLANVFCALLAPALLVYSNRTGRYRLCYIITITGVFIVLFSFMFFSAGGYHSGMPSFFVFAFVFTMFMLEGKTAIVMTGLEALTYTGICLYAYRNPGVVDFFVSEKALLADVIFCFMAASLALGTVMFIQLRMYKKRQRELEEARAEALRLSKVKSNFLANMSHEIRTPINVILGMNEMVLRESSLLPAGGEQIANYGLSVETAGKTLLELINNILDISKIESGKTEVLDEEYKTADLVRELSLAGSERAGRKGLRFVLEADEDLPRELYGDFIHIKQIGLNFLSNAVKYTEQGSVTLRIGGSREERADAPGTSSANIFLLRVAVEDTGIGIKEEDQGMLFDAFTRVDLPGRRNIEGTGLGLAIAKELAELMGGKIIVQSAWGKGSLFALEVSQIIQRDEPMGREYAGNGGRLKREGPSFTARGGRILAVDDNRENILVLRSLLRRTLLTVDTASSGSECLEKVRGENYQVIFMDYMMSGMDGIETFRRLREEHKNFRVPVIALSADARQEMKKRFLEEGFSAYLTKPVMWRDLEQCLRAWLPAELVSGRAFEEADFSAAGKDWRYDAAEENRDVLAKDLAAWGVLLDEGQCYLEPETGLAQYKRLAEFFTENYESARKEVLAMADQKNWKDLHFSVHSLKSKARAMGAADLYATAAAMEKYCGAGDGAYIEAAMPLFLLEWERASRGLEEFTARMDELAAAAEPRREETAPSGISDNADRETLLRYIRGNLFNEAKETLSRLLAAAIDEAEKQKLKAAREKINALDFEGAEKILQE